MAEFECTQHGWWSEYQVCPFCVILVLEQDNEKLKADLAEHKAALVVQNTTIVELGEEKFKLLAEVEQWKSDYYVAAKLVADLYEVVTGNTGEPIRGVVEDVQDTIEKLTAESEIIRNVCDECDSENYGWIFNRVEGRGACTCMLEAEPFQILLQALDKVARLGNGDRFGNSEGNCIALDALRAVLPLDYAK